ncbi:hypothetical protein [Mesorhizobium muleiense]|uniref:hypothetical protein n=1 Tax=Mesorhizobium muleiense TaxID=1004279 RepID=UPI001F2F1C3F|nr:hypothetical protein [Mesorhizobium muleiense]MCF6103097.1 hypothetical protein [Mesorhizobium muleiense]
MNPTELQAIGEYADAGSDARDDTKTAPKGCKKGASGRVKKGHRPRGVLLDHCER